MDPLPASDSPVVYYQCGGCGTQISLKKEDPIRCRECGYRILYKVRTNNMVQWQARCSYECRDTGEKRKM